MKLFVTLFLIGMALAPTVTASEKKLTCNLQVPEISEAWIDLNNTTGSQYNCLGYLRKQVQLEIQASYNYMAMAAHFSQDTVNRPGFAELFFKAAREEREHGSKLIEYMAMRGHLYENVNDLITVPQIDKIVWLNGAEALSDALDLEVKVTTSIRNLINVCEGGKKDKRNFYHLADYLTGVYLEEQLHGQRELAGKLMTLQKMMQNNGALGEFLFDKNL